MNEHLKRSDSLGILNCQLFLKSLQTRLNLFNLDAMQGVYPDNRELDVEEVVVFC